MDRTFSKAQLLQMNSNPIYGFNWILNINNIGANMQTKLYPTGNAWVGGKFYVAFPSNYVLTQADKNKWNMF